MAEDRDPGIPRKKRSFGSYIIPAAIAILVIAGIVMFTRSGGENTNTNAGTTPTTIPTILQLQSSIDSLNAKLDGFSGRLANLESAVSSLSEPTVTKANIDSLQASINDLSSSLDSLEATVANLTGGGGGNTTLPEDIDETTRWAIEAWADYAGYNLVDVQVEYSGSIEDEEDYNIYVMLTNLNLNADFLNYKSFPTIKPTYPGAEVGDYWCDASVIKRCIDVGIDNITTWQIVTASEIYRPLEITGLNLVFRPKSGDRVIVSDKTYIDSYSRPYLDWETEITTRDDSTCRKIKADTDTKFTLPVPSGYDAANLENPTPYELELEFELYYN